MRRHIGNSCETLVNAGKTTRTHLISSECRFTIFVRLIFKPQSNLFFMKTLIESLKEALSNANLYEMTPSELEELIDFSNTLIDDAKEALSNLKNSRVKIDDDEFIEFEINGTIDRIKKNIEVLNISCNNFKTLPSVFYHLTNLKTLYLYNNNFSEEEKRKIRRTFPASVQIHF